MSGLGPCDRWEEAISARLDGELAPGEGHQLDVHLAACPRCRALDAEVEALHRLVRVRPADAVPDLTDAILSRVDGPAPGRHRRRGVVAAAAVVVLAAIGAAMAGGLIGGTPAPAPAIARIDGVVTSARVGTNAAVYLSVVNEGGGDRLTGAWTARAEATALHGVDHSDGVVVMTDRGDRPIAARGTTILGPGGSHVMLNGVLATLEPGQEVEVTLEFERSESRTIRVQVVSPTDLSNGQWVTPA